jgi:hypothetical protein
MAASVAPILLLIEGLLGTPNPTRRIPSPDSTAPFLGDGSKLSHAQPMPRRFSPKTRRAHHSSLRSIVIVATITLWK